VKVLSIVGARPEFIQAASVSRALRARHEEVLVHTGQHYDYRMSQAFFDDLNLPKPQYNLDVGSGSHAAQTGQIMVRLEEVIRNEKPTAVLVRGDTNSTLAGAIAASKLGVPIVHVEAGERSFNRSEPEEINRLVADRLATVHLCASRTAVDHLAAEGICGTAHFTGDVMLDATLSHLPVALTRSTILDRLGLEAGRYALVTVHRAVNTDNADRLQQIVAALNAVDEPIVFPVHPRTRKSLEALPVACARHVQLIDPVGYLEMLVLEKHARLIATDSGGVQREAYFHGIPCLTLRDATEWAETVEVGWNRLVGTDANAIAEHWFAFKPTGSRPPIFGDGHAADRIAAMIESCSS